MSNYCVTFRIGSKVANGRSDTERRDQLIKNIRTDHGGYWDTNTSFFLVESNLDTDDFGRAACKGLSEADDVFLMFDLSDMSAAYFGAIEEIDVLRSFFRVLDKVP